MSSPARSFKEGQGAAATPATVTTLPLNTLPLLSSPQTQRRVQAVWRARALRYVLIYLLLACVLVTLRYQTREVYPSLRRLNDTRTELQRQQSELSLTVQTLTSEQRVRVWALANGMVPYAQASKQTQTFAAGLSSAAPLPEKPSPARVSVGTVWR